MTLTLEEARELIEFHLQQQVGIQTLRRWCRTGKLPATKAINGRSWLVLEPEFREWLKCEQFKLSRAMYE